MGRGTENLRNSKFDYLIKGKGSKIFIYIYLIVKFMPSYTLKSNIPKLL